MDCDNPVWKFLHVIYCDSSAEHRKRPLKVKVGVFICRTIVNFLGSVLSLFLLWLIFFRPYSLHPHVDAAALAAFDLTGDGSALGYDLALNVTFFNDHRIYGIRFDHLTARLYYGGTNLGPSDKTLPTFTLGPRRRRAVYLLLRGRVDEVGAAVAEEFSREQAQGRFSLDVRVRTTLTYKFWPTRADYYHQYNCRLQFPAPGNDGTPALTAGVNCGVAK